MFSLQQKSVRSLRIWKRVVQIKQLQQYVAIVVVAVVVVVVVVVNSNNFIKEFVVIVY